MKKETLLIVVVTLVVGILVGILVNQSARKPARTPSSGPPAQAVDTGQEIQLLEKAVARDPGNRNAWVRLGHAYFDTQQHAKAVEAYDRALELDPNDPNVLTDQGVMFRRLGWYDRAVENFNKANRLDPSHAQSLFNMGIVYAYDLKDFAKAREAWEKFLNISPMGPGADQVRAELQRLGPPGAGQNQ